MDTYADGLLFMVLMPVSMGGNASLIRRYLARSQAPLLTLYSLLLMEACCSRYYISLLEIVCGMQYRGVEGWLGG